MRHLRTKIFKFSLPLKIPVSIKQTILHAREGFLIRVTDENGTEAWGEITPLLPQDKSGTDVAGQLMSVCDLPVNYTGDINIQNGFAEPESLEADSVVRFGVESARMNLLSAGSGKPVSKILNNNFSGEIPVNGLVTENESDFQRMQKTGVKVLKLKIGRKPIEKDVERMREIESVFGLRLKWRLDANRLLDSDTFRQWENIAAEFDIEYLEEPFPDPEESMQVASDSELPVALDETLETLEPVQLHEFSSINAVILKPALVGSLQRNFEFVQQARRLNMKVVISDHFQTAVGRSFLAHLASAWMKRDIAAGLDTGHYFETDLSDTPLRIRQGRLSLPEKPIRPRRELLESV